MVALNLRSSWLAAFRTPLGTGSITHGKDSITAIHRTVRLRYGHKIFVKPEARWNLRQNLDLVFKKMQFEDDFHLVEAL